MREIILDQLAYTLASRVSKGLKLDRARILETTRYLSMVLAFGLPTDW